MLRINIVTPCFDEHKFSGGIWCIMQYANGLAERGNDVRVIPILPSKIPQWTDIKFQLITEAPKKYKRRWGKLWGFYLGYIFRRFTKSERTERYTEAVNRFLYKKNRWLTVPKIRAIAADYFRKMIPEADVTIATAFETAMPVYLFGKGKKMYFIQHYEPYFKEEYRDPKLAELEAKLSYQMGLSIIANSSWLKNKMEQELNVKPVELSLNAINQEIFQGQPRELSHQKDIRIISYGGRDAQWKGFREMAQAIRIARSQCPDFYTSLLNKFFIASTACNQLKNPAKRPGY